jgi:hypothetical protein
VANEQLRFPPSGRLDAAGNDPPTAAADQANEQMFLSAMGSLPMYVRLNRYGDDADLLKQGTKPAPRWTQSKTP